MGRTILYRTYWFSHQNVDLNHEKRKREVFFFHLLLSEAEEMLTRMRLLDSKSTNAERRVPFFELFDVLTSDTG